MRPAVRRSARNLRSSHLRHSPLAFPRATTVFFSSVDANFPKTIFLWMAFFFIFYSAFTETQAHPSFLFGNFLRKISCFSRFASPQCLALQAVPRARLSTLIFSLFFAFSSFENSAKLLLAFYFNMQTEAAVPFSYPTVQFGTTKEATSSVHGCLSMSILQATWLQSLYFFWLFSYPIPLLSCLSPLSLSIILFCSAASSLSSSTSVDLRVGTLSPCLSPPLTLRMRFQVFGHRWLVTQPLTIPPSSFRPSSHLMG